MKLKLLTAAASVALLAVPTLASASDAGWYVRGNVGYGAITDVDLAGDLVGDVEGEANAALSLGVGYEFGNNWRLELDATQLWNDMGAVSQAGNSISDMRITSGMLNAIYDFSDFGSWQPYIGAGIGIARASLSAQSAGFPGFLVGDPPVNNPTCPNTNVCTFRDADTGVAWQLLAGLGYEITDNLTWDTQYRYLNVGDLDYTGLGQNVLAPFGQGVLSNGSGIATTASGAGSHTVMTGLRYRFGAKPAPVMYSCWDGSSVLDTASCPVEPAPVVYTTCWDGTQVESTSSCPARPMVQCWDGSTVTDAASCPTRPTVTCWDGTIAYDQAACPVKSYEYTLCENEYRQEIIYYEFDKPQSDETLSKIQRVLDTSKHCSVSNINVVGHTDSSGSAAYNMGLSKRRAADVRKELVGQGISKDLISSEGKGETQLFIETGDGVKESLNRRTEVLIRLNSAGVVN